MDLQEAVNDGIECCNVETGEYFRAIGLTQENGRTVILVEPSNGEG